MPEGRSFRAVLEPGNSRLNWVVVRIPFDVSQVWGVRGQLRVKGNINGFGFQTSLFPDGRGGHVLLVNKRMQKGGGASVGIKAAFHLEQDTAKPEVAVPPELQCSLSQDRSLLRWFGRLNHSTRKYIADWVAEVKSPEARERRANQMAERLMSAMDAEKDLPPVVRLALDRRAAAAEGWKLMSPTQRRAHLLAIFYYRDPRAQARRADRAAQEAAIRAAAANSRSAPC
jgi:uncharacterized protein YdeI (YjbR/CyaY-like superfamily)